MRNLRLKTKLVITYVLLTVIPMAVLGFVIYYQNTKSIEEEVGEYIPRLLQQANQNIENEISDLENLPDLIYSSSDVMAVLRTSPYQDQSAKLENEFIVENFLSNTYLDTNNPEVLGAFLLSQNRSFVSTILPYEGFESADRFFPYGEAHELGENAEIYLPDQIDLRFEGNPPYLLLAKEIQDLDNRTSLGTLFLAVKVTFIEEVLQDVDEEESASMWLMDNEGQVIYHTDSGMIGTDFEALDHYPLRNGSFRTTGREEQKLISVNQSSQHNWVVAHSIPIKFLTERTDTVRTWSIVIFLILVFIATLLSVFLARTVSKPINQLSRLMKKVEEGDFDVQIPIHSRDEVGILAGSFQSMVNKIKQLINKNYQIEIRQKNAELYALQSQINPHFMYNTLETIRASVEDEEKEVVEDMISILGNMLRYSLSNQDRFVRIADEVRHIENYLILQKFRFEERIWFEIEDQIDADRYYTPKFILQPLIENAIKYGMENRKALCINLRVTYEKTDPEKEAILFTIQDDGPGIEIENLQKIYQKLQEDPMTKRESGFGITNVHSRITMLFGDEYGLSIQNRTEEGTKAEIRIPLIEKDQAAEYTSAEERGRPA